MGGGAGLRVRPAEGVARPVARKERVGLDRAEGVEERRVSGLGSSAWVAVAAGVREFGRANQRAANRKSDVPGQTRRPAIGEPFVDRKKAAQAEEWLSRSLGTAKCWS